MATNVVPFQPSNAELYRASTDAAGLCRDIVKKTAQNIQGRSYVKVEGWMAIATAHGCMAGSGDVEVLEDGVRAIGEIRRMSDGQLLARAEGFVGKDEPVWYGGESLDKYGKTRILPKRADYAIRAMAQTRAISRACRSAFAHVVVLIDANLSTTPAEEMDFLGGAEVIDNPPAQAQDIPNADHPNAPRQEPAQAGPADGRAASSPRRQEAPAPSQRGYAPSPTRTVNRGGVRVPSPMGEEVKDWQRWFRAVGRRVEAAGSPEEVVQIGKDHAEAVERGNKVIDGSAVSLREIMQARMQELQGKAA